MPKQELHITDFSGGLNSFADARDIDSTQFAQNWNASLDKYGVVRFSGAGCKYTTYHPHTNTGFVPGGGLFSFTTDITANSIDTSDMQTGFEKGTVAGYNATTDTTEILNNTGNFSSNWTRTGDFAIDATDATYTHSTGAGTLYQTSFSHTPTASQIHKLEYTISSASANYTTMTMKLKGGTSGLNTYFADNDITLPIADGTHIIYFKAHTSIVRFEISVTAENTSSFNLDNLTLKESDLALKLSDTPTLIGEENYNTDDVFNNMLFTINVGPGKGQSRIITDYIASSKCIVFDTAFGLGDSTGDVTAIDGNKDTDNVAGVAKLRVYAEGKDGYHFNADGVSTGWSFLGSLFPWPNFVWTPSQLTNIDCVAVGWKAYAYHNHKRLVIKDRDGKMLTMIFVQAWHPSGGGSFPILPYAGNHYDNVTTFQQNSPAGANTTWSAGDRIFDDDTNNTYYLVNVQGRTKEETTSDITAIVNAWAGDMTALSSYDEDGFITIITLTAGKGQGTGEYGPSLDCKFHSRPSDDVYEATQQAVNNVGAGNRDCELEVFQNFTGGLGDRTNENLAKITLDSGTPDFHGLNIGEYITIAGAGDDEYNDTHEILWIEPSAVYIYNTSGDSTVSSATWTSLPISASSKYLINNIKASSTWKFSDNFQGTSLQSNKSYSSTTCFLKRTKG